MKTVAPIPERMAHLRVWRGVAVPVGVVIANDGRPMFSLNNEAERARAVRRRLCPICGTKLFRGRWLVGGPLSALHPEGAFIDPPMHSECMRYSLQVCPYLAMPNYSKSVAMAQFESNRETLSHVAVFPNSYETPGTDFVVNHPAVFVAIMTTLPIDFQADNLAAKPRRPFNRVEYWREGKQISDEQGAAIAARVLREFRL